MSKKKSVGKVIIPKEKIYEATKERFNPYQTGHGAWKDKSKYTRKTKHKRNYE